MTLHDANEATEKANEQVRLEKQRATELENELKQVQQCTGIGPAARLDSVYTAPPRIGYVGIERKGLSQVGPFADFFLDIECRYPTGISSGKRDCCLIETAVFRH